MAEFFGIELTSARTSAKPPTLDELRAAFEVLRPKASPSPLIRVGPARDGGYLLPDDLGDVSACFSPGVNNFKHFEDELSDRWGVTCHMCDRSSDVDRLATPLRQGLQTFEKVWLEPHESEESVNLAGWVKRLAPDPAGDLILQMDIEGAEYRNLLAVPDAVLSRFRIVLIELHGVTAIENPAVFRAVFQPILAKLDRQFVCVHAHPNNCCGEETLRRLQITAPRVLEVTFLRRDRVGGSEGALIQPMLPHPLDMPRNVRDKPPLFLENAWFDGERPLQSRIKKIEDQLDWLISRDTAVESREAPDLEIVAGWLNQLMHRDDVDAVEQEAIGRDVAAGRPFTLSSAFGRLPKSGVVRPDKAFFFHTALSRGAFIRVDLGERHQIEEIWILNRRDMCQERAQHLFAIVHDDAEHDLTGAIPIKTPKAFLTPRGGWAKAVLPRPSGRYVSIVALHHTALHFADLKIIGTPVGPSG